MSVAGSWKIVVERLVLVGFLVVAGRTSLPMGLSKSVIPPVTSD